MYTSLISTWKASSFPLNHPFSSLNCRHFDDESGDGGDDNDLGVDA